MKYITSLEAAEKWGITQRRVAVLCSQNRIDGAVKAGKTWLIPEACKKPTDSRCSTEFRYKNETNSFCVKEPQTDYLVKTELMLDPYLVNGAKNYYSNIGKTLSEGINDFMYQLISVDCNYRASYHPEFFGLFGSAPNLECPDDEEDLKVEDVVL